MIRISRRRFVEASAGALALGAVGTSLAAAAPAPAPAGSQSAAPAASMASILGPNRVVTYYGNPWAGSMGILGQLSPGDLVSAIQRRASAYSAIGGKPVIGAIHMVVTVAQGSPGADGLWRLRMPASAIKPYVDLAAQSSMMFIADVQVGRSTVQDEVPVLAEFLQQPHVHLALDPEFDMWGSQVPGVDLGHMTAAEINWALGYLGNIAGNTGQRKILMTHQFAYSMLPDKQNIGSDPRIDLAIVMDGWGGQSVKIDHYNIFVANSSIPYGGIKLFFDWDPNMMSNQQVMGLKPAPDVVIYQ